MKTASTGKVRRRAIMEDGGDGGRWHRILGFYSPSISRRRASFCWFHCVPHTLRLLNSCCRIRTPKHTGSAAYSMNISCCCILACWLSRQVHWSRFHWLRPCKPTPMHCLRLVQNFLKIYSISELTVQRNKCTWQIYSATVNSY